MTRELVCETICNIDDLSALVADAESGRKGMPILLKQYLKLGGELVTFNVDRKFADTLDGLIVVDLRKTEPRLLERYLGKAATAAFAKDGTSRDTSAYA